MSYHAVPTGAWSGQIRRSYLPYRPASSRRRRRSLTTCSSSARKASVRGNAMFRVVETLCPKPRAGACQRVACVVLPAAAMGIDLELMILRPGPDGLTRVTARYLYSLERRSFLVLTADAENAVLDEWATEHRRRLGFRPTWFPRRG